MSVLDVERLQQIKTFPQLLKYLRDELDWPIESDDVEDLTFEYEPEELGLDPKQAAKIRKVKQLRPLDSRQPWGIFFVEFERKRLPVVVLRRVLSHLVVKKRASANKAERAAWHVEDLLFISAFGDQATAEREIAFAHFHQDSGDLPTLRVLGWDGGDAVLKVEHVAATLKDKLRWPANPADHTAWRNQWSGAFRHRIGHVIRTADALAERLAALARGIRDAARTLMRAESERGQLRKLHKAFQTALIHDLTEESFADTYAQTIAYGLLTAAISRTEMSEGRHGTALIAENVADIVPVTNPFLKEMLQTFLKVGGRKGGIDFDELGIQDVVELLRGDETDLPAILRDFGNRTRGEDPVIHFYEHFLSAYDKQLKVQRGVFYTPQPVVSYIVRGVHELLQTEFGLEDGLASTVTWGEMVRKFPPPLAGAGEVGGIRISDGVAPDSPFVVILDIATGTGTFYITVIDVIFQHLRAKWEKGGLAAVPSIRTPHSTIRTFAEYWNAYVPEHLLPRIYGYELMMAPYAIAHMRVPLKLKETGFTAWDRLTTENRVRIYLTNTLEPASDDRKQMAFADWAPALAHEAQAVNKVKREQRFTVVIGNPPYAVSSANESRDSSRRLTFIGNLIEDYKHVNGEALGEKNPKVLQDDYVKFIRFSQWSISLTGLGVLGVITNHSYLDNLTFRGMRRSLITSFPAIHVLDLHGNLNKQEVTPDGSIDENVFDIKQGVALFLGVRKPSLALSSYVRHSEMWGLRKSKYEQLTASSVSLSAAAELQPSSPLFFFIPQSTVGRSEYEQGFSLISVFALNSSCMNTARDALVIDCDADSLRERIAWMADPKIRSAEVTKRFGIESTGWWSLDEALASLRANSDWKHVVIRCLYRPMDVRWLFHHAAFIDRPRAQVNRHMLPGNISLVTTRQTKEPFAVVATNLICGQHKIAAVYDRSYFFPLFIIPEGKGSQRSLDLGAAGNPNLAPAFLKALSTALNLAQKGAHGLPQGLTPEDIFHYAYAVFHSLGYRTRYAEFLKIDFPRLLLTSNLELFRGLAKLGGELVALHLLESPKLEKAITRFVGNVRTEIEKISYAGKTVWIDKAQATGFADVPENVWEFHIGGYQVCEKWLKDRKDRKLSADDIAHYHKIVVALAETIRLMKEIDEVIEQHGGWPAAFAQSADGVTAPQPEVAPSVNVVPLRRAPAKAKADEAELPPLLKAAELEVAPYAPDKTAAHNESPVAPAEIDRDDVICLIRKLFNDGAARDRDSAIGELARDVGYQRTGSRIGEELDDAIRTAVRRGILDSSGNGLVLATRTIENYDRDFLKEQLLASLQGRAWTERDTAIRVFARWMGFLRTGATIDDTARSLINGLIREGRLESEGSQIRRSM